MKINELLKAIKLRIFSSKICDKLYYENSREVFFSDCYNNVVGSFVASNNSEDVLEVSINVEISKKDIIKKDINYINEVLKTFKTDKNEESENTVCLQWVNPSFREKRDYALKKIKKDTFNPIFNKMLLKDIESRQSLLVEEEGKQLLDDYNYLIKIIGRVCEGDIITEEDINYINQDELLSDNSLLELSKIAYKEDVSIKQLVNKLLENGLSIKDINSIYINKTDLKQESHQKENFDLKYNFIVEEKNKASFIANKESKKEDFPIKDKDGEKVISILEIQKQKENSNLEATEQKAVFINSNENDKTEKRKGALRESRSLLKEELLPDCINGMFHTKKGFIKTKVEEIDDYKAMSLKERVNPTINMNDNIFHKHLDGKIYLSNLKVRKIT